MDKHSLFQKSDFVPSRDRMKIVTLNMPVAYLNAMIRMENAGLVPSRSQAVRNALCRFLEKEVPLYTALKEQEFDHL